MSLDDSFGYSKFVLFFRGIFLLVLGATFVSFGNNNIIYHGVGWLLLIFGILSVVGVFVTKGVAKVALENEAKEEPIFADEAIYYGGVLGIFVSRPVNGYIGVFSKYLGFISSDGKTKFGVLLESIDVPKITQNWVEDPNAKNFMAATMGIAATPYKIGQNVLQIPFEHGGEKYVLSLAVPDSQKLYSAICEALSKCSTPLPDQ